MKKPTVLRIGLEVKDAGLHAHIRSVEEVAQDVRFGFGARSDLFITDDAGEIEKNYVPEKFFAFVGTENPFPDRANVRLINPSDVDISALSVIETVRDEFLSCAA